VAGHSLGGVAACEYAKANTQKISGLILLGSFCNGDAKNINTKVLSVSTSKDGLSTPEKIQQSKDKLPKNTDFVIIDGGNHSQFADLEKLQPGDNEATITQDEATSKINDSIINFIIK
jgi:pimeloyl-ACP methyl ester carboxylesterase